jgi:hypothetical protein
VRAWFLHAVPDLVYNHVMVTDAATYQSLGHLIEDVRHAVMTTGHRVISVDMIDDRLFTFRLVNEAGVETGRAFAIRIAAVQHRMNAWDIEDDDLYQALCVLLPLRETRDLLARWFSQEMTLEEAVAAAGPIRQSHLKRVEAAALATLDAFDP